MAQPTVGTPITVDASGGTSGYTIPNVVIASGESLLVVTAIGANGSATHLTSLVRNGESLAATWASGDANFCETYSHYKQGASVGTFNCVVTPVGSFNCVSTAMPIAGATAATGARNTFVTSATPTISGFSLTANDIILAGLCSDTATPVSVTSPGVQVDEIENILLDWSHSVQKVTDGTTTQAVWSTANDLCAMGGVVVQGAASVPTITGQPSSVTCKAGGAPALFSVSATTSGGSLSYQWKRNGSTLTGETSATLIRPADPADSQSSYVCTVTDSNGSTDTNAAILGISYSTIWLSPGAQQRF